VLYPVRRLALVLALAIGFMSSDGLARATFDLGGVVRVAGRPERDVVVWLDGARSTESPRQRATLDQRNLTFSPRVLVVRVGTPVTMPNSDRVFHNVFSFKDGKRFDLGVYPVGQSKVVTFDRAGVSRVFCNIHPNMAAYVVVVDSDFFAVSAADGSFGLPAVPSGSYTYRVWRAGTEVGTGEVQVAENRRRLEIDLR
jgi:plastocyanin